MWQTTRNTPMVPRAPDAPVLLASVLLLAVQLPAPLAHYHPPEALQPTSNTHTHAPQPQGSLSPPGQLTMRGPHHPRGPGTRHQHYTPQRAPEGTATKLTQDTQLLHDEEHIREDLGNVISKADTAKMTAEELEFHYFKLHDFDNNTKLDGLEILQAIQHVVHDHDTEEGGGEGDPAETTSPPKEGGFTYYVELIDKVLAEDDLDNDGFLSYIEYVLGRQKDDHELRGPTNTH